MQIATTDANEHERLDDLRALHILDTLPEERFDRLTRLARRIFSVPTVAVSFVDSQRQWFKSRIGLDVCEMPRDISFCSHAILQDDIMVVSDTMQDERFKDNPLVVDGFKVRFYAGCPIASPQGNKVGALCLIDTVPRHFDASDHGLLRDLGRMIEQEMAAVYLATMDTLTKLSNRRGFEFLSTHALHVCKRLNKPASLLYFDLDMFKQINDRFGHAEGDQALIGFSRALLDSFRESDVIARIGGDEFAVLLTGTSAEQVDIVLSHLEQTIHRYNHVSNRGYDLLYSVGAIEYQPAEHGSIDDLMKSADALMYENKKSHRQAT